MREEVDFKWKAVLFGLLMTGSGFTFGYTLTQFNSFFKFFMAGRFGSKYAESEHNQILSNINALGTAGALFCTITSPLLLKYCSRLWLFYVTVSIFCLVTVLQIWAPLELLYVLRFMLGYIFCFYGLSATLVLRESLPSRYVGIFGGCLGVMITLGFQVSYLLGFEFFEKHFYVALLIPAVFDFVRLLLFLFFLNVDTPNYIFGALARQFEKQTKDSPLIQAIKEDNQNGNSKLNTSINIEDFETLPNENQKNQQSKHHLQNQNEKIELPDPENEKEGSNFAGFPKIQGDTIHNKIGGTSETLEFLNIQEQSKTNKLQEEFFKNKKLNKYLKTFYKKEKWTKMKEFLFSEFVARQNKRKSKGILGLICSKQYAKQFWLIFYLNLMHQMTGISVIIFYSTIVFRELELENPEIKTFIIGKSLYLSFFINLKIFHLCLNYFEFMNKKLYLIDSF